MSMMVVDDGGAFARKNNIALFMVNSVAFVTAKKKMLHHAFETTVLI